MNIFVRISFIVVWCAAYLAAGTFSSAASGVWSSSGTWQSGTAPTEYDTIVVSVGHTVTIDMYDAGAATLTVKKGGTLQFDGVDGRALTLHGDLTVESEGKIIPSDMFENGAASNDLFVQGNLTVDGAIKDTVKGSSGAVRSIRTIEMGVPSTVQHGYIRGNGFIGVQFLVINKGFSTDTVSIEPGVQLYARDVQIFKGTLDNSKNNISVVQITRHDESSNLVIPPQYVGIARLSYLGMYPITTGVELPDTISTFIIYSGAKTVTLHKDIVVVNQLLLYDGELNTGEHTVKVTGTVGNNGPAGKGFVIGSLEKPVAQPKDSLRTFEVGTPQGYAEVNIKFSALQPKGSLVVNSHQAMHQDMIDTSLALRRYWTFTIKDSLDFKSCDVTLRYSANDFAHAVTEKNDEVALVIGQYDPKAKWQFPAIGKRDSTGAGGTIQAVGLTNLADLVIVKNNSALPVKATSLQPVTMELKQNFPNPFNPSTEIRYQTSEISRVSLKVYDALGREVATLVNEVKEAGHHAVTFNAFTLASGIYFAQLESGEKRLIKKIMLIR